MRDAVLVEQMRKKNDQQQLFENQMRQAMVDLQRRNADAEVARADREFKFRNDRAAIDDARYGDQLAYGRGRDRIADERYTDQQSYGRGRDKVADDRYTDQVTYGRGRDKIGDDRYAAEVVRRAERDFSDDKFKGMELALREKQIDAGRRGSVRIVGDDGEQYTLPLTDAQLGAMQTRLSSGGNSQPAVPTYRNADELLAAVRGGKISKDEAKAFAKKQGWN